MAVNSLMLYFFLGLTLCVTTVLGSHFRGAIFMVRPNPGGAENEMEIFYHISWRRTSQRVHCDQSVVDSGVVNPGEGTLNCDPSSTAACNGTSITDLSYKCTGFSIEENWNFGENQVVFTFIDDGSPNITIEFTGNAWISPFNSDWRLSTTFSLARRADTGEINSTPRAITSPVIRIPIGVDNTIRIAVTDPDDDIVRCRWAVGEECAGICDGFPEATLDSESCSLFCAANNKTLGFRAVAIMIEDFLPGSTEPLSSVGLQFLVLIVNGTGSVEPSFVPPTLPDGSCVAIPSGETFSTRLSAVSNSEDEVVTAIQTVGPTGLQTSALFHDEDSDTFSVNITWTPTPDQQNVPHLFCYTATNSGGLSSSQVCIELLPGLTAPAPISESATPNMEEINPSGTTWCLEFDREIVQPLMTAFITFHDAETDEVVYSIDTSSSSEIVFQTDNKIALTPSYTFEQNKAFYINLDRAVVVGVGMCGLGNEPVRDKEFWTFTTPGTGIFINDTVIGDPLFTVALPEADEFMCYEVHGEAGKYFNLVSDTCTSVNALFSSLPGNQRINRMSVIGVYARDTSGDCVQIQISLNGCQGYVDGVLLNSTYSQNSIRVRPYPNRWRVSVPNCGSSKAVMWIFCDSTPEMLRFHIARGNNLAPTSHGLLAQFWNIPITPDMQDGEIFLKLFDPSDPRYRLLPAVLALRTWDHTPAPCYYVGNSQGGPSRGGPNSGSVVEGALLEYETTSLFATLFMYSEFEEAMCNSGTG